jgi:hypothetical protein
VVDLERGRATWLDLRLFTPVGMPQQLRRADHLRTLLCGLAAILPAKELSGMVRRALAVYSDRNVLAPLRKRSVIGTGGRESVGW